MLKLYANIRKRRKELNMSQDELAKKVGYTSRSTIARIENGEIDLSRSKIVAIAKALKTTPAELMGLEGTLEEDLAKEYSFDADYFVRLSKDSDLMEIVRRASDDEKFRERLKAIVKLMENDK